MASLKKCTKSKFISEDINELMNSSQFLKKSPINKKNQKRPKGDTIEDEDFPKLIQVSGKKKKIEANIETGRQSRQKIIEVMDQQLIARSQNNETLLKCLSELTSQLEADHSVMKENEQKLEQLTGALMKCIQQATIAHKQKLKALKEIHDTYKKQTEGLLTRGAMKPDDRPLWFDVYRAFPPHVEPKFAKPKPEIKPIRPILYQEDAIRAKFHSNGHGLAAINIISQTQSETQTKRLIQQYQKLQSEGVPENELVEKSVAAVASQRQVEISKYSPKNPESVTAQVLTEADIKNIFKE